MSIYEKFTKDVGIIAITNLITPLGGLILLPIIVKTLGASGYGIWAQVLVTLGLINPIADLTLSYTFVRFFAGVKDKKEIQEGFFSILITMFCWSSFIALILFFLATPIANILFNDANAIDIVKIAAIIVPLSTINSLLLFFFRTYRQMKTFSALLLLQNFVEIAAVAYFVLSGFGVFGAVISILIVKFFMDILMFVIIVSQVGMKIPNFSNIRSYLKFGMPLIPSQLSSWVVNSSDRYVIGIFRGIASVGIYSAAYGIGSIISMFLAPLNFVLVPALSKSYDEGKIEEVKNLLSYSLKYLLMLAIPSAFGLSILAKPILQIMTKPEFVSSGCLIIPFVALSMVLFCIYGVVGQVIVLVKKTRITGTIWVIAGLANLGLNIIFVPKIGIFGAAITTLIAFAMATAITSYYSFKFLKFDLNWLFLLKAIVASVIMCIIIWYINPIQLLDVLLWIGIGAGIYAAILFLLKGFTREEIKFFRTLFKI